MRTLLLIPVYNCSKTLPTLFSFLYKLEPQPTLTVFAENNSKDDTLKTVYSFRRPHKVIRVWFKKDAVQTSESVYEPMAHIRQLLLTFARQYDPDYAFFIDSDVYPKSRDLLESMTLWNKDIVGGAYWRLFPEGIFLASKWINPNNSHTYQLRRRIATPLDEPAITSAGCLCLSRKIIQDSRVNFYPISRQMASEDFGYCLQARDFGYGIFLDGTVRLCHYIPKKMPIKPWSYIPTAEKYEEFVY